jgi:hypothetical protein
MLLLAALFFLLTSAAARREADELQALHTVLSQHLQKRTTSPEVQAFGLMLLAQIDARADASRRSSSVATADDVPALPLLSVLQLAQTRPDGGLVMPPTTRHVIIEIGCSDRDTADDLLLPHDPHAFLISFEPLLDKYSLLLGRGTSRYHANKKDLSVPLGHHHPRGVVLPLAVSPAGAGVASINVSRYAAAITSRIQTVPFIRLHQRVAEHAAAPHIRACVPDAPLSAHDLARTRALSSSQVRRLHVPRHRQSEQRLGAGVQPGLTQSVLTTPLRCEHSAP